ncbi:UNVERIFIED_CONTAM: hypothetical protein K2H54_014951 [Gekko kuhli]
MCTCMCTCMCGGLPHVSICTCGSHVCISGLPLVTALRYVCWYPSLRCRVAQWEEIWGTVCEPRLIYGGHLVEVQNCYETVDGGCTNSCPGPRICGAGDDHLW